MFYYTELSSDHSLSDLRFSQGCYSVLIEAANSSFKNLT